MTSVRDDSSSAPQHTAAAPPRSLSEVDARYAAARAAGRAARAATPTICPGCGREVAQAATGRRRAYCRDACRKRTQRAAQAPAGATSTPTGTSRPDRAVGVSGQGLGTTAKTTDMQVSGSRKRRSGGPTEFPDTTAAVTHAYSGQGPREESTAARDGRFQLREDLRMITVLERLKKCGASVLGGGVVPTFRNGRAGYAGVVTCGSVHVCPCCSTSVRRVRQDELDQVGTFWECQSCGLVMMTVTMRHYLRHSLALLTQQQRDAWRLAFGSNAGRTWRDAKKAFGVVGYIRAWETTWGPTHGWHVHYHVLLFLDRPWNTDQVERFQHIAFTVWSAALERVGAYLPAEFSAKDGKAVGVKIDAPDRGEAGQMARYLMKGQDGKTSWGVAAELTRQDVKQGSNGHRTPFEIARAAVAATATQHDVALWREFEEAASGIRSLYWSNGLKARLKALGFELDDRNDDQVAADEAAAGERLAMIPAVTWYRHIVRHRGRALALLRAAESLGVAGVRVLIESWGLVWGADIHPAEHLEPSGLRPTADEVLRRLERTTMAERAQVWRRAFDAIAAGELAERLGAVSVTDLNAARDRVRKAGRAADVRAEKAAEGRRLTGQPIPRWWAEYEAPEVLAELRETAPPPQLTAGQRAFVAARDHANTRRGAALSAAVHRWRNGETITIPTTPHAPVPVQAPPAPNLPTPPASWRSQTCRRCGGDLAPALMPYGRHVDDCLKVDGPVPC